MQLHHLLQFAEACFKCGGMLECTFTDECTSHPFTSIWQPLRSPKGFHLILTDLLAL